MPEPNLSDNVLDNVVEVDLNPNEEVIAMDLPAGVGQLMMTETAGNIQANNRDGRNAGSLAALVLQAAMARNFDELGTIESRANSGVMATPIASPAVQTAG